MKRGNEVSSSVKQERKLTFFKAQAHLSILVLLILRLIILGWSLDVNFVLRKSVIELSLG